jgi:Flp pilus assembly protein TadB
MVRSWWRGRHDAIRDLDVIMACAALLVAGGLFDVLFLEIGLVLGAVVLVRLAVRHGRRAHVLRTQPPPEFWADRLSDS